MEWIFLGSGEIGAKKFKKSEYFFKKGIDKRSLIC
jgi:hypothetical protein